MNARAYYNEFDPYAAQWLRNLIAAGHIAPGDVDERSIADVEPADLAGYTQCHFFAGVGVWSYALRLAGWPDDRPIWTGSAPCQPFSTAGKQRGEKDERHLWPEFMRLIAARRPECVLGEQVSAAVRLGWLDAVFGDLAAENYASGAVVLGAHSVGAPHIRQRLFWVGHAVQPGLEGHARHGDDAAGRSQPAGSAATTGGAEWLAVTSSQRCDGRGASEAGDGQHAPRQQPERLRNADGPGPTDGFWRAADWLFCRDGRWRPVEPGLSALVDGSTARMGRMCPDWRAPAGEGFGKKGRLKGYGNAIVAPTAAAFVRSVMEMGQ